MEIEFHNKHLQELYESGRSSKYRIPKNILNKYFMRIQSLKAAEVVTDLWKTPSLNFKKLEGYANRYAVRLQDKWRLEFDVQWDDESQKKGIICLMELSNHYGD